MELITGGLTDLLPHPLLLFGVTDRVEGSTQNVIFPQNKFYAKRASKIIVPGVLFSIERFWSNYDVRNRKHLIKRIYSIVRKQAI